MRRSSRLKVFYKRGASRNFAKLTGKAKHLCQSLFGCQSLAGLSWANLRISEVKMAKLGLFTGNVIFLRYILAINDFDALAMYIFTVNILLMDKLCC